ncbi:GNAT family N-acetyltransferase [Sphingobium sp. HBC34]|uniref:Aminoglycoside N(6')-acetyltransferase type 1 n=1 Tax=Sphingobium cyanobacteriorum TaxID=3063954 RepID=A0ABT8ZGR5_9SPHN|nr:aminoglycoside 6'-N-acetyltransferase [Sphingobium sp. HBC34]MDO7833596.1 GNAT family N-acetyltransferase [Sphingobium sp. HBC34]
MTGPARILRATTAHVAYWATMRAALWPDASVEDHREEIVAQLRDQGQDSVAFLAFDAQEQAVGFVEAALRHDYVNGCDTSPVAFLEGLYVEPAARRTGAARALVDAAVAWGRALGCTEMASDADIANHVSHLLHAALGFTETERVVYFRKLI